MKRQFLGAFAVSMLFFTACNNDKDGDTTATGTDTSSTAGTTVSTENTTTISSSTDYSAFADSVERNSQQGYYLNPKTGKAYKSLKVDRTTGRITDDAGEPVWRYVDNRNWWVWGDDNWEDTMTTWSQVGEAKKEGDALRYKGDDDKWVDYNTKWKVSDDGMKRKMVTEDGDKIKVKTDEEGNTKIKVNDQKTKIDKDGNVKKD